MIAERLTAAREATLACVADLDDAALRAQPDPSFSPIGWHLGHVAFTEALWILRRCGGDDTLVAPYARAWAQDGCPKSERAHQPPRQELLGYMQAVRSRVLVHLPRLAIHGDDPLTRDGFVGWLVEAHEHQHRETMAIVRQLELERQLAIAEPPPPSLFGSGSPMIGFEAACVERGTSERLRYDNERPAHEVEVAAFELDAAPATVGAWERFRADGGYARPELWTDEGWAWRASQSVHWPRGLTADRDGRLARPRVDGALAPVRADEPVLGVSFYEAEAFARWRGARLPTEAEWERAARADDPRVEQLFGAVWQWTSTPFAPYPGFEAFPYRGYSEPYFDGVHRVLRGGSTVTDPRIATSTFRNWYQPWVRAIFAGVRCAR